MRFKLGERRCEMAKNFNSTKSYSLVTVIVVALVVSVIASVATTTLTGSVITGNAIGNYANELWGKVLRISGDGKGQFAAGSTSSYSTITSISDKSNTNSLRTPLIIDASSVNIKGDLIVKGKVSQGDSVLLRARVSYDSTARRNEVTILRLSNESSWETICMDKIVGEQCDFRDFSFWIVDIGYVSGGDEYVVLEGRYGAVLEPAYETLTVYEKEGGISSDTDGRFIASI